MIPKILKIFLAIIIVGIIIITVWEYWESTHRIRFKIKDKYQINLFADECGTCFLDWQIEYVIRITDLETNENYKYKFWTGEGPLMEFGIPKDGTKELILRGYDKNYYHSWIIDFQKNKIESYQRRTDEERKDEIEFVSKLDMHFKIVKN